MAGARLEYCAKWQQMASAQESNNQMAIGGSCRPTEKNVAQQSRDHAGQKKHGRGNQGITPAKRKIVARQSMDCAGQKNKIAARQSGYCAGQKKKKCGAAIDGLRPPTEQNSSAAIRVSPLPLQNLRRGNQGITPASSKIAQGLGIAPNG